MGNLTFLGTVEGPFQPYGADILGLDYSSGAGGPALRAFAGYGIDARLVDFDVSDTISSTGQSFLGASPADFVSLQYGAVDLDLSVVLLDDVLDVSAGAPAAASWLSALNSGQAGDTVAAVGIEIGGARHVVTSWPNGPGLVSFRQAADGSMVAISPAPDAAVGAVSDLAALTAYGQTWVLASSSDGDSVSSYLIDGAGALSSVASFGAADGLGVNTPTRIETVMLEGQPHVIVASAGTSSLSVLRLEANGSFTAIDHVLDDLNTRFADTTVLETVTIGDTTFLLAAGSDDGFTLFRLRPDGKLFQIATVADTAGATLDNVSAAALGADGADLRLFLASSTETGISQFSLDISTLGATLTGTSADDALTGSALDDLLLGYGGDDTLNGGDGDDIIVDGAGADVLTGGAGADLFTLEPDGADDTITDFQRGLDALDLSHYPLLHDPNALGFVATSFGARLSFQGEILQIISSDGNPLSLSDITAVNPFNLDRPPLVLNGGTTQDGQTQIGAGADDNLVGTMLDDMLTGNGGDDILIGGQGADTLMGGAGFDTASYATATQAIVIDRQDDSLNTGDAAGDVFVSIEAIAGTGFADTISGLNEAETISGGNGSDLLDGRGGDDVLQGGFGYDILIGGAGADWLDGGSDTDQASYATSLSGLRVDLAHMHRNTGDAAGDSFSSIEDLGGSDLDDALYGDSGGNTLLGRGGDDWLIGRDGDDSLSGGAGDDVLVGGAGADVLDGGAGQDRAQYFMSKQGLTVDLANPAANTGEAAGDTFVSIEDLAGSRFDDQLSGNSAANRLLGNAGDDILNGASGDDVLNGGSGDDRLVGGAGNDRLIGGAGRDVFEFASGFGQDRITDFDLQRDLIDIDIALLGATQATGAALLADYGAVVGQDAVVDFGAGNLFVIENVTDLSALNDVFLFF